MFVINCLNTLKKNKTTKRVPRHLSHFRGRSTCYSAHSYQVSSRPHSTCTIHLRTRLFRRHHHHHLNAPTTINRTNIKELTWHMCSCIFDLCKYHQNGQKNTKIWHLLLFVSNSHIICKRLLENYFNIFYAICLVLSCLILWLPLVRAFRVIYNLQFWNKLCCHLLFLFYLQSFFSLSLNSI